MVGCAEIYY